MPAQVGSVPTTGAEGVIALPQLSVTVGGVGAMASATQATVDAPSAGSVKVGALIVYTYVQVFDAPAQSV